jgi:hypothetical protein
MIPVMSKKQVSIVLILDFDIRGFFGVGEFIDLHSMDWCLASWRFVQFNAKFHVHSQFYRTLHFHVWTKLMTHSDRTSCCSAYPDFPCELCLVASPNIPSNSVARSPGAKLKMRLETYLHFLVFYK